jgi:hypothetical protein
MNRGILHYRLTVPAVLVAAALGLAACGGGSPSSSASSTTTNPGARSGGFFSAARDPKVQACLKKQGVTLPNGRFRQGNGQPPARTTPNGAPRTTPNGQRPGNSAQFQKLRAALQKCGVQLPTGPPGGAPPSGGASGTSTGSS